MSAIEIASLRSQRRQVTLYSARRRTRLVTLAFLSFGSLILFRLVFIQLFDGENMSRIAERQGKTVITVEARRGGFYDRNGILLTDAVSDNVSLWVDTYCLVSPNHLSSDLAKVVGGSQRIYWQRMTEKAGEVRLARHVKPEQKALLDTLGWKNIITKPEVIRVYPYKDVGAQALGFLSDDGDGIAGFESVFDSLLKGQNGERTVEIDALRNIQYNQRLPYTPPLDGDDVILTIDVNLQSILQAELKQALAEHSAASASGIIMDPRSGEILSIATENGFDPNRYLKYPTENQRLRAFCDLHELGSVFKVVPMALLLERGYVNRNTVVDTRLGYIEVCGHRIYDSENHGIITADLVIALSSNVGIISLSRSLDARSFYCFIERLGALNRTGLELPGERTGCLRPVEKWSGLTQANVAIGYGLSVTMLHIAHIYQAIANDGVPLKPRLVFGFRHSDGQFEFTAPVSCARVFSKHTADELTSFLVEAVEMGTCASAQVKGVKIAAKTGTANKPYKDKKGYDPSRCISTMVGFYPADSPKILLLVSVDEPQDVHFASKVCGPIFRGVTEKIIDTHPEYLEGGNAPKKPTPRRVLTPDYCHRLLREVQRQVQSDHLNLRTYGKGDIIYDQTPPPGALVEEGAVINLTLGPEGLVDNKRVVVPMLVNLSLRDAVAKATRAGLIVKPHGSGKVVKQIPEVGSTAAAGSICMVIAEG